MQVQLRVSIETGGKNDIEITKTVDVGSIETAKPHNAFGVNLDYDVSSILHDMATSAASVWRSN